MRVGGIARSKLWGDAHPRKPFTTQIILSQPYALLRRVGLGRAGHAGQFDIGTLAISLFGREVRVEAGTVELTRIQFELLRCLTNSAGRALSYRSLVSQVHGYDRSSEQARAILKVHIDSLRNKTQPAPDKPGHILNVRGFGYLSAPRGFRLQSWPGRHDDQA